MYIVKRKPSIRSIHTLEFIVYGPGKLLKMNSHKNKTFWSLIYILDISFLHKLAKTLK